MNMSTRLKAKAMDILSNNGWQHDLLIGPPPLARLQFLLIVLCFLFFSCLDFCGCVYLIYAKAGCNA
jgi:hypothetical protein